jgi:parvulin-like peptidyl-prolyl isomerase
LIATKKTLWYSYVLIKEITTCISLNVEKREGVLMNNIAARFALLLLVVLMSGTTACVATHKLPVIEGKETVAMVNGEPITRDEYQQEISALHAQMSEEQENKDEMTVGKKADEKKPGRIDYAGLMKRMIDARLIVQEGKRIGLNDLPELKEEVENYSRKALRTLLMKEAVKDVKPDASLVENLYEKAIREWKFESVYFPNETDAKQMETEVRAGGSFDKLADKAVAVSKGKAKKGVIEGGYMKGKDTIPAIGDALLTMGTGSVSPVISVPGGYAIVKLEDTRIEDSPEKREWAAQEALRQQKAEASLQFIETLKKKLAKTDTKLLDSIHPGASVDEFDKLLKDDRVITTIGVDEQIKVSDLANAIQRKYFHGVERAIGKKEKELKAQKYDVLDGLIERKVLVKEAKLEGIEKTEAYGVLVRTYENSLVFGMFVQNVVLPDIKVMESEVKAYYEDHRSDYTSPESMKLDSVVFKNRNDAEEAMRKLRAGDQLSWIKANAGGQVAKDTEGLLNLSDTDLATTEMSKGLKDALSGAGAGDFRLYESPEGYFYVIAVSSVIPPKTEDYLSVRGPIAKQLFSEHVQAGIADWVEKLRSSADIKVYLKD